MSQPNTWREQAGESERSAGVWLLACVSLLVMWLAAALLSRTPLAFVPPILLTFLLLLRAGIEGWGPALLFAAFWAVPDMDSRRSFGLPLLWSHGLTLSNFLLPLLAIPLVLGDIWRRRRELPWCSRAVFCLFLVLPLSLTPVFLQAQLSRLQLITIGFHWLKLLGFVWLAGWMATMGARPMLRLLTAGLLLNAVVALLQCRGGLKAFSSLAEMGNIPRASGLLFDPNLFGTLAAATLMPLLAVSGWRAAGARDAASHQVMASGEAQQRHFGQAMLAATAVAVLAAIAWSASRAAFLGLLVGLSTLAALSHRTALLLAVAGGVTLALLFPGRVANRVRAAVLATRTIVAGGTAKDAGTAERFQSMQDAWQQFRHARFGGLGFGHALYVGLPSLAGVEFPTQALLRRRRSLRFGGAQNSALTSLAETGVVGCSFFVLCWGAIAVQFWRLRRHQLRAESALAAGGFPLPPEHRSQMNLLSLHRRLTEAALAALAALFAASLTNEVLLNARILGITLALLGAIESMALARDSAREVRA